MATYDEVFAESLEYFKGDELAASVFATKYALQDEEGNFLETNPDQMHKRLASERQLRMHRVATAVYASEPPKGGELGPQRWRAKQGRPLLRECA